jgi:F-type H+-transporting ATPase subunit b
MTIDWWTLGIQAVNVVILIWLLGRFFWRPVAAMIEQRRAAAQKLLTEAETKRSQATDALVDIERIRKGFDKEREAILAAAQRSAEQARAGILASAAKEAAALETSAKAAIEKERDASEKVWAERANRLAIEIAERLVARLGAPAVNAAFLDWLLGEIRKLPASERSTVAANGAALEAVSAAPIEPAEQERYRRLIGEAFGAHPRINFRADPTLIAGLELHGPHLVINNSWRADLASILADLEHDA